VAGQLTSSGAVQAALLRPLTVDEAAIIDGVIDLASTKLRGKLPTVDDRIAAWSQSPRPATALDPELVAAVLAGVIKRALLNPKGLWSTSETDGDYSISETYPAARGGADVDNAGGITITDADLAELAPAVTVLPATVRLNLPRPLHGSRCW
jgi:hypothetical protein